MSQMDLSKMSPQQLVEMGLAENRKSRQATGESQIAIDTRNEKPVEAPAARPISFGPAMSLLAFRESQETEEARMNLTPQQLVEIALNNGGYWEQPGARQRLGVM